MGRELKMKNEKLKTERTFSSIAPTLCVGVYKLGGYYEEISI